MAVLATISAGLLATTWRLVGFARDEAEHMVADAYCHDVMWAVYSQNYTNILKGASEKGSVRSLSWVIDPEKELPHIRRVNIMGQQEDIRPLWRSGDESKYPTCYITVAGSDEDSKKTIMVAVSWYNGSGEFRAHTNSIDRAKTDRGVE